MPLVFCVEDEENIRELVGYALRNQNFEVETFADAKALWSGLDKRLPDLLLLDIMLPGESGMEILKKLRQQEKYKNLPVIMLTAKTSEYDIVRGLDGGADDYVTKPFGIVELVSRIRAVLRRSGRKAEKTNVLTAGPISLDQARHRVTVDGQVCELTLKEFELLHYLLLNAGIVLQRERIMEKVWGFTYEGESRTIDMHIKSLRQKLGDSGQLIRTVRGVGYVLGDV